MSGHPNMKGLCKYGSNQSTRLISFEFLIGMHIVHL